MSFSPVFFFCGYLEFWSELRSLFTGPFGAALIQVLLQLLFSPVGFGTVSLLRGLLLIYGSVFAILAGGVVSVIRFLTFGPFTALI